MGRKKITFKKIPDQKLRFYTYVQRRKGLFKKATEIGLLCGLNVKVILSDQLHNHVEFKFSNPDIKESQSLGIHALYTPEHYPNFDQYILSSDKDIEPVQNSKSKQIEEKQDCQNSNAEKEAGKNKSGNYNSQNIKIQKIEEQ